DAAGLSAVEGQPEARKERLGVQEEIAGGYAIAAQLENDDRPGPGRPVLAERGGARRRDRYQTRPAAVDPPPEHEPADALVSAEPEAVGRHREGRVVVQEAHEGVDVVALERFDIAVEERRLRRRERGRARCEVAEAGELGPGALEGAVDRS